MLRWEEMVYYVAEKLSTPQYLFKNPELWQSCLYNIHWAHFGKIKISRRCSSDFIIILGLLRTSFSPNALVVSTFCILYISHNLHTTTLKLFIVSTAQCFAQFYERLSKSDIDFMRYLARLFETVADCHIIVNYWILLNECMFFLECKLQRCDCTYCKSQTIDGNIKIIFNTYKYF